MSLGSELARLSKDGQAKKYATRCEKGRTKISEMMIIAQSALRLAAEKGKNRETLARYLKMDKDVKTFVDSEQTISDMRFKLEPPTKFRRWYRLVAKW